MTREHFEQDQQQFRDAATEQVHTIGWAVKQMWDGGKVQRAGWNGKGQYIAMHKPPNGALMTLPYVFISTVQGDRVPWLCSQTDLLATDWEIYTGG